MALPIGARLGYFETNEDDTVWTRSVWISPAVQQRMFDRVKMLEGLPTQASNAKASLRSFLQGEVGQKWASEDDAWLYKVLGDFVYWPSGVEYLRTVFEPQPMFARALPPQPTEIAPGTKPPALIVVDDEPTTMTTTRKLAYAGTGLGLLAALAALLWYLGAF